MSQGTIPNDPVGPRWRRQGRPWEQGGNDRDMAIPCRGSALGGERSFAAKRQGDRVVPEPGPRSGWQRKFIRSCPTNRLRGGMSNTRLVRFMVGPWEKRVNCAMFAGAAVGRTSTSSCPGVICAEWKATLGERLGPMNARSEIGQKHFVID